MRLHELHPRLCCGTGNAAQESRANDPCRPAAQRWDGGSLDYIDRLNAFGILRGMYLVTKGNDHSGASDTYICMTAALGLAVSNQESEVKRLLERGLPVGCERPGGRSPRSLFSLGNIEVRAQPKV